MAFSLFASLLMAGAFGWWVLNGHTNGSRGFLKSAIANAGFKTGNHETPKTGNPALIAIDIGHSISKPGATSARGVYEFFFNRDLALAINDQLAAEKNFRTLLVNRNGDIRELTERSHLGGKAAFFLSVHHDSAKPEFLESWVYQGKKHLYTDRFKGFSLFVSHKNRKFSESLHCASAIGAALRDEGFSPSHYHADPIEGEGRVMLDKQNGVHAYDDLIVLKTARSPAVLLEAGVIVNRDEELAMKEGNVQGKIARAVKVGLGQCF